MGRVIVINWLTVDGVMQAPGRADEDTRGDFAHGGWAAPFSDATVAQKMSERMRTPFAWLFGRRSYEDLLASWNAQGGPFMDALNDRQKYVASHDPRTALRWPHSTLLSGDVREAVAELKRNCDANLVIMGSGVLIASLIRTGMIDEYLLLIAPLVLGEGRRLFAEGVQASLSLCECTATATGALIASYEPAR